VHRLVFLDKGHDESRFVKALDANVEIAPRIGIFLSLWPLLVGFRRIVGIDKPVSLINVENYVLNRI
jgi:hypothetical protein